MRAIFLLATASIALVSCYESYDATSPTGSVARASGKTQYFTVDDRLVQYGPIYRNLWKSRAGTNYPPKHLRLVGFKDEDILEVWQLRADTGWHKLKAFPIKAASGGAGPKLKQGDYQVPEGFYRITALNPNSSFHLSMRVNYPNNFDRATAASEGRSNLGGDIYIHGNRVSAGCLALGDRGIEELFVLVADTRRYGGTTEVLLLPGKPDQSHWFIKHTAKKWTKDLYFDLYAALSDMGWR